MNTQTITIDGRAIPYQQGQTIMDAALAARVYIPYLCYHSEFNPQGGCKLCTVQVNGRVCTACTMQANEGQDILNDTRELNDARLAITQMLFVEGNHFCPFCEKSGSCELQALGYYLNMMDSHFPHFYPRREIDASHPDIFLDRDRCVFCELCVRASRDVDGKNVFDIGGRGINTHLMVNSPSGKLADSGLDARDKAARVCPVGAILVKGHAFEVPIGKRIYDQNDIGETSLASQNKAND